MVTSLAVIYIEKKLQLKSKNKEITRIKYSVLTWENTLSHSTNMTYIQQVEKYLHYVKKQNKILHAYYLLNTNIYIYVLVYVYIYGQ